MLTTEVSVEDQVWAHSPPLTPFELSMIQMVVSSPQLTQGLKVALDTSFVPNTGWVVSIWSIQGWFDDLVGCLWQCYSLFSKKSGKLKTGYKRDFVNASCDVHFEGPVVHSAAVLGYEGWLFGYLMVFDMAKSKLVLNNFALGYKARDFQLHTNV